MKVALVHDWLTGMRGGEKVLEIFCELYPTADLYTLLHIPGSVSKIIEDRKITTSFLQNAPMAGKKYRWYLPLMPRAIETFYLTGYDLVISSSHCVAKGAHTGAATHVCYCHTPMRYAWDMYHHYFNKDRFNPLTLYAIERMMPSLRRWDKRTAGRVDHYIANSGYVAERIKRLYGFESDVMHPPADTQFYSVDESIDREHFLIVSAFAPYKRVDLAIEAFAKNGLPLVVAGGGEDDGRLRSMAAPNIKFVGKVSDEKLRELYRKARAFIFPGEEDFGITPLEAMACGTPVIAFGKGGALETVTPLRDAMTEHPSGIFFDEQSVESLENAIEKLLIAEENGKFSPNEIAGHASNFSRQNFIDEFTTYINRITNKDC